MRLILVLAALLLAAVPARAQVCSFSMPNVNFGTIDVTSNINFDNAVNFTASCTGTPGATVRICPNFNTGSGGANASGSLRYMVAGANLMSYNIYRSTNMTTVWGSFIWGRTPTPPSISFKLSNAGTGSSTMAVRLRVQSGQTALPVGTYTSSFAGAETRVNYAYSSVGNCSAISSGNRNPTQTPFTVTAAVGGGCAVTAANADFGTQTALTANIDQTSAISVRCPVSTPYTIGLNGGTSNAADPTQRKMSNGIDAITYGIYRDAARTLPWGNTIGTNTASSTGTGAFQTFTAYLRLPPQVTPPADIYDDAVVVTITY
jgi:spore coat protein U-like protein